MKVKALILVIVVMLFSCNVTKESKINDIQSLYGKWTLMTWGDDLIVNKCNACPKILFTKDGKAKIIYESDKEVSFTYTLDANNKKITFSFEASQTIFKENNYSYKMFKEENFEMLEISTEERSDVYIWGRTIASEPTDKNPRKKNK